ncbi:MAG: arylsulfatase [Planctomycetota bacterium]|nr:arylsulfatase [Planctomycetota bacterium]
MKFIGSIVTICLLGCLFCGDAWGETKRSARPPNIVFIMADDLGMGDLGCYNTDSKIPTPNMDTIASQGMRFHDAHSPSAVCSPTRYGVLTGRYAWRSRLKSGVGWGYSRLLISPQRETVASLLKRQGYRTACIGKWHLGFQLPDLKADDYPAANVVLPQTHPHAVDYFKPLTPGPNALGFDYFYGIPASLDMDPYVFVENDRPVRLPTAMVAKSGHRRQNGGGFWRGGKADPEFKHVDVLPVIADKAVAWIQDQDRKKPFFLYFPLSAPHTPWLPTADFKGKASAGYYGDFVNQCDHVIGQVVAALKKGGHLDHTLLVVTSDNGSHWVPGDIPKYDHRANLNYRGQKADIWEGGHRVPFLVRWPGHVQPGTASHQTICLTDLMATAMEITGDPVPTGAGEDSYSFLSALAGDDSKSERDTIVHHSVNGTFAVRIGDWKLIPDNLGSGGFSAPRVVKPAEDGPGGQLYNLREDPGETKNVWLEQQTVVKRLQEELKRIQTSGQSRRVP